MTVAKLGSNGLQWPRGANGAGTESLYGSQDGSDYFELAGSVASDANVGRSPG